MESNEYWSAHAVEEYKDLTKGVQEWWKKKHGMNLGKRGFCGG